MRVTRPGKVQYNYFSTGTTTGSGTTTVGKNIDNILFVCVLVDKAANVYYNMFARVRLNFRLLVKPVIWAVL